ncbi:hypothetical protein LTR37_007472 [Vermiconidia calcicola]|uniref:Uncharacterized protein n=1 Tax=Vermiconidia calcicola TaxID=1690605 RepID=A0ACC3NDR5_9PEZI|nr:hypothetical protein LTR37_007472 [Vermiconidia calcicola]
MLHPRPAPAQNPGLYSQPNTQLPPPNPQIRQPSQQLRPPNTQAPLPNPQVQQPNQQLRPPNTQPPPPNPQVQQPNQRRGRLNLYTRENGREARGTWCLPDDPYGGITASRDVVRREPTYVPHESVDDRSGQYGYNPASPYPQYQQGRGDRLPENVWAQLRPRDRPRNETTPLNAGGGYAPPDQEGECGVEQCEGCYGPGPGRDWNCHPPPPPGGL